jgi:hypothetical protein
LNGENTGDLPAQEATKFQFIINIKTAKALGTHPEYNEHGGRDCVYATGSPTKYWSLSPSVKAWPLGYLGASFGFTREGALLEA